jgi:amino acid adenylation domain-containing protein
MFAFPLSYAQQRLWLLDRLTPGSALYTIPATLRLTSTPDIQALGRSLNEIVRRHETLRTTFSMRDNQPIQVVAPHLTVDLPIVDLQQHSPRQREAAAQEQAAIEARRPFDLETGPLFRSILLRLTPEDHLLLISFHHLVADGWSLGVFFRELAAIYPAFVKGLQSPLPNLPIQYPDYVVWQKQWLEGSVMQEQLGYWRQRLSDLPALVLPTDRPRSILPQQQGARQAMVIPSVLSSRLAAASQQEGSTLFMTLLAAFQILLQRYSGQEDFAIGTPIANRTRVETEGLIGLFVNTLVLRADVKGDPVFRELMQRVRQTTLEAYAHQDVPFERLVEDLQPPRDPGRNPLIQILFSLQNMPTLANQPSDSIRTGWETDRGTANFDLTVDLWETSQGLESRWEYQTDLFDDATISRMMGHFQNLLYSIATGWDERLSRLSLLTDEERHELLFTRNEGVLTVPRITVHECFAQQAARTPDAIAVVSDCESFTYRELDQRANQIARYLQRHGVAPGQIVGVQMQRYPLLAAALLGVLKAGAAYLPFDLESTADITASERQMFILQNAGVTLILADSAKIDDFGTINAIALAAHESAIMQESAEALINETNRDGLAYVIYTSGSTGKPKGVLIPHKALINHCYAVADRYGIHSTDRVLQFAAISFDVATEEIFPTLLSGATVVFSRYQGALSFAELQQCILQHELSVLNLPASYWHEWVNDLADSHEPLPKSLRLVITGSERVSPEQLRRWQKLAGTHVRWLNAYGVTEATITATVYEPYGDVAGVSVPIGRPLANIRVYVLDRHLQPVPTGVAGELCIGGECLALGYLGNPAPHSGRFIDSPFEPGARLYRTGDLVRYRADGNLEFIGRMDTQIKLRGYRIEPEEIEAAIMQHATVHEAVVVLREQCGEDKHLVAYVSTSESSAALRKSLQARLPKHMIPTVFVPLDRLPRAINGKIDYNALPVPPKAMQIEDRIIAPRNPVEAQLAELWATVLGLPQVGITDNFFDLGGHSLLATQLLSRLRTALGIEIPLRILFETPTIEGLAAAMENYKPIPLNAQSQIQRRRIFKDVATEIVLMSDAEVDKLLTQLLTEEVGQRDKEINE